MYVRAYDNGGETHDRYTIIPDAPEFGPALGGLTAALNLSDHPTWPLGVSQWSEVVEGPHLGRQVSFDSLPDDVRAHANRRMQ